MRTGKWWMGAAAVWLLACGQSAEEPLVRPPQPSAEEVAAALTGLGPDDFLRESYGFLLRRSPERLTDLGLSAAFGVGDDWLDDISDDFQRETIRVKQAILELLRGYPQTELSAAQRRSFAVYDWWLDDAVRAGEFFYQPYPATQMVGAAANEAVLFFSDVHPIATLKNAEDYIARLWQVDDKFAQLIDGLERRAELGFIAPRLVLSWTRSRTRAYAQSRAADLPFYTSFAERLSQVAELDGAARRSLLERAERAIERSVIPAYRRLDSVLARLEADNPDSLGVWSLPDGEAYYAWALRHHSTQELSAAEIHQAGLEALERIHGEMRERFDLLGYPADESLGQLYARVAADGGFLAGSEVLEGYRALLEQADADLDQAFDIRPAAEVIVQGAAGGGFYLAPAPDGSRPGIFYANVGGATEARYAMPSLIYHETLPGHHLQIAIALELDLPLVRRAETFTAHAEGWALYAERLAWELGWYDDDPYGDLGRLQAEAFRAARLVVDTGLHAEQWTYDQALAFMRREVGDDPVGADLAREVGRYLAWPGQATAYYLGMERMLELRQRAMDELGERFDLRAFHRAVLLAGSLPLDVLEQVVDQFIAENL